MELQPLCQFSEVEGNLQMSFRALPFRQSAAIFRIRTAAISYGTVEHDTFSYNAECFLSYSRPLRDSLVSQMVSGLPCFDDHVRGVYEEFWCDRVSNLVEVAIAVHAALQHDSPLLTPGIQFDVKFHVGCDTVSTSNECGSVDITKLKRLKYDDDKLKKKNCTICFEEYESGGKDLTLMSCLHSFHYECIAKWLEVNPLCSLCRKQIH